MADQEKCPKQRHYIWSGVDGPIEASGDTALILHDADTGEPRWAGPLRAALSRFAMALAEEEALAAQLAQLTTENQRLRKLSRAWRTVDGVWVCCRAQVWFADEQAPYAAEEVDPAHYRAAYSTPEAVAAAATDKSAEAAKAEGE